MLPKPVDLKKASSYYLIGSLFNKGIGFITVPIFSRMMSIGDYGIVTTYNSWVAITTMIISLALYMAVRSAFIDYLENVNEFLSTVVSFTILYGVCFWSIVFITIYMLQININAILLLLCLLQSLSAAIIEDLSMFLMMKYKYRMRTAFMVLPGLISTIIAVVLILSVKSDQLYWGRILSSSVVTCIFAIIAVGFIYKQYKFSIKVEYVQYGLRISVPLILHGLALNILSQADRTMISMYRSVSETGIYGLIYNFSMIAVVLTTAMDGIWIPWFTKNMNTGSYEQINRVSKKMIWFMAIVMNCVVLVGPEIVKILSDQRYWEGIPIIPPLVLSNYVIYCYTFYVNVEHYYKKTVFISVNTCIAAISNIIMNIYFIQIWGYKGAAYSTLISYIIALVLHAAYSRKINKELYDLKIFIFPFVSVMIVVVAFFYLLDYWLVRWLGACFAVVVFMFKEKDNMIRVFKK